MLKKIGGKPMLGFLLERLGRATKIDKIIIATSIQPENDAIEAFCLEQKVSCFRGSEDDVLSRLLGAARFHNAEVGVVVFGDGPLIDPTIVDHLVSIYQDADGEYDFVGNDLVSTYPPGMEAEVFSVAALEDANTRTDDPAIREHGTLYIRQNPDHYRVLNVEAPDELRRPELEIEVDTSEDFEVITRIIDYFEGRTNFSLEEIIQFLDKTPAVADMNREVPRRWKQFRET